MTVKNISRSISTKECCRPRRGLNPQLLVSGRTVHPSEPPRPALVHSTSSSVLNIAACMANCVDPDQMPNSAASDLGLQFAKACLSLYLGLLQ